MELLGKLLQLSYKLLFFCQAEWHCMVRLVGIEGEAVRSSGVYSSFETAWIVKPVISSSL